MTCRRRPRKDCGFWIFNWKILTLVGVGVQCKHLYTEIGWTGRGELCAPGCFSHRTEPWDLQPSWRWFSPPADCRSPWSCRPGPVRPPRSGRWKSLGGRGSKPRTIWNKKNITHLTFLAFRESGLRLDDPTHCFAALKVWDNKLSTPTSLPTSHFPLPNWNFTLYCGSESPGWYC